MNSTQITAIIRNLLIPLSGAVAAHGIAAGTWDGIVGFIAALALLGWGVVQHDTTQDMLLSVVRSGIGALGGYFVQRGWATSDQVTMYSGITTMVVPNIWTWFVHADPAATSSVKHFAFVAIGIGAAKWLIVGSLALALSGCATTGLNSPSLKTIYEARATYDGVFLAEAAAYSKLPRCAAGVVFTVKTPCSDSVILQKLQQADKRASDALDAAEAFSRANPGAIDTAGLFSAATTAVAQAQEILAPYVIK